MREKELIVYKDFGLDSRLIMDMVWLMEHYGSGEEGVGVVEGRIDLLAGRQTVLRGGHRAGDVLQSGEILAHASADGDTHVWSFLGLQTSLSERDGTISADNPESTVK